jgi:signal transduction histidine kinase
MNLVTILMVLMFSWMICLAQVAAQPVHVLASQDSLAVTSLLVLEDSAGNLDVAEIIEGKYDPQFASLNRQNLNLGFSDSTYWLKFRVLNQTENEEWYITAQNPLVQFAVYHDGIDGRDIVKRKNTSRWRVPFATINLPQGKVKTFIIEVSSFYTIDGHFKIETNNTLTSRMYHDAIFISLLAGCLLAMILYNLILYVSLRDKNYLYYLLFAIINSHLNLLAVNFPTGIYSYLGIDWAAILGLYRLLGPLTAFLFTRAFLQTRDNYPLLDWVFRIYMSGLILLMLAFPFTPNALLQTVENIYFLVGIIILLLSGWISLRSGFSPSRYYLAGIGIFLLAMFIYLSAGAKLLPANPFTLNILVAGQAAEMLLMSLALAGKVKILQSQKDRAETAAETKSRLIRILSHDIANPLTVLRWAFSMLKPDRVVSHNHQARIMRAIASIEEIMCFARKVDATEREMNLVMEQVSVKEVFSHLDILFQEIAKEKGIELNFSLEGDELLVKAEKTTLTNEVLANLLSNAIKFSFPNSTIHIRAYRSANHLVYVEVEDKGIGMNSEIKDRLFQLVKSPSRRGTHNETGTGYGIVLVRSFVVAYGAKLEVESRSIDESPTGHGTIFRIILNEAQADKKENDRPLSEPYSLAYPVHEPTRQFHQPQADR